MAARAPFITFEGPDGAGKSTQIACAVQFLEEMGYGVESSREPGGTPVGEKIRDLLLDKENRGMTAKAELLLYAASRAQHVEARILPALEAGRAVILDRFVDSTMAFQGFGRQLGRELVETVNDLATGGLTPDITFVFLLAPKEARERMAGKELDRMELEAEAFRNRVYEGYCRLGEMYPDRVVLLDARADIDTLSREVQNVLKERIGKIEIRHIHQSSVKQFG